MQPLPCSCSSGASVTIELIANTCTAVTCLERHLTTWHLWCRDDPTIFGYNLMNEPRSQAELYIVVRQTTDGSKIYNISYNPADDLQSWIEDMAAYVKSLDPIHLLSTGQLSSMSEEECHKSKQACCQSLPLLLSVLQAVPPTDRRRVMSGRTRHFSVKMSVCQAKQGRLLFKRWKPLGTT